MAIEYVRGNIIELFASGEHDILIHGCNCFHTMGKGLAKALADKWPIVLEEDMKSAYGDYAKLGEFTVAKINDTQTVWNLYSQYKYSNEKVKINYAALEKGLEAISNTIIANDMDDKRIIMPLVGGNNAGGDPIFIKQIIQGTMGDLNVTVVMGHAKEVRDVVHVIQFPVTALDDLDLGFKLFRTSKKLHEWLHHIGRYSCILIDSKWVSEDVLESLARTHYNTHFFVASERTDGITLGESENIHYFSGYEHTLMRARDFCNETDRSTIFIMGGEEFLVSTRDYSDLIHHLELREIKREADELPDYSGYDTSFGEETRGWINDTFKIDSQVNGHYDIDNGKSKIMTRDCIYRRGDKPYRY